jgi:hypothetical protein
MRAKDVKATKLECPDCKTAHCFNCREPWHGAFTSCEKAIEKKFKSWEECQIALSFCPKCKTKIEKESGCNKMLCNFCHYKWCWLCKAPCADYVHFASGNVFGCTGLLFSDKKPNMFKMFFLRLFYILCFLFFVPALILIAMPFVGWGSCLMGFISMTRLGSSGCNPFCCFFVLVVFAVSSLGAVVGAIASPFVVIFFWVETVYKMGKEKRLNQ